MAFPAETLPDGSTLYFHHIVWGIPLAMLGCAVVWDNYRRKEPFVVAGLLLIGWLGFVWAWHTSPALGAILSLIGTIVPIAIISADLFLSQIPSLRFLVGWTPWESYPKKWGIWVVFWTAVALDDAISHSLGWPTPLDLIWKKYLIGLV